MDIGIVRTPYRGEPGKSAYDLAVIAGFEGTLEEWLVSLKGATGLQGLDGPQGPEGLQGEPGESSYDIAIANGYIGSEANWYAQFDPINLASQIIDNTKPFVMVWNTELISTGSSNNNQIKLPLVSSGVYNFNVEWGDGTNNQITDWEDALHIYSKPGKYLVSIKGLITGWRFNNTGDKLKLISVYNWGNLKLTNTGGYLQGCTNLRIFAEDIINAVDISNFSNFFNGCSTLNTIKGITYLNTASVINMSGLFKNSNFNQDISNWDFSNVINFTEFLTSNNQFSTANYDKLLISLAGQSTVTDIQLDAPLVRYSANSELSRTQLINQGWIINDAGLLV